MEDFVARLLRSIPPFLKRRSWSGSHPNTRYLSASSFASRKWGDVGTPYGVSCFEQPDAVVVFYGLLVTDFVRDHSLYSALKIYGLAVPQGPPGVVMGVAFQNGTGVWGDVHFADDFL